MTRALNDAKAIRDRLTSGCPAPLEANLVGEIRHRKVIYPGLREPIVEPAVWQRVQEMLNQKAAHPRGRTVSRTTSLLMGRLFDENGEPLYSCWAKKRGAPLRYFVSKRLVRGSKMPDDRGWRLPAGRTEEAVTAAALHMLSNRVALASTLKPWPFCIGVEAGGRGDR